MGTSSTEDRLFYTSTPPFYFAAAEKCPWCEPRPIASYLSLQGPYGFINACGVCAYNVRSSFYLCAATTCIEYSVLRCVHEQSICLQMAKMFLFLKVVTINSKRICRSEVRLCFC